MRLRTIASNIDGLLAMSAEELGLRLLPLLVHFTPRGGVIGLRALLNVHLYDEISPTGAKYRNGLYPGREREATNAVAEAWAWLEGQGLLVPALDADNQSAGEGRTLSRRAAQIAVEPQTAVTSRHLAKETIPQAIREDVWSLYHRGKFDAAVFEAMRAVEVEVRAAAGAPASVVGVKLMRVAFAPEGGPLTDVSAEAGERVARMEVFAGAIGSYKNPQSHRKVALDDPDEAAEIIMLACHLLRIVDTRTRASTADEEVSA